ncbi:hypothetical protein L3X38_029310 [Prunus dulcis]|uniref:Uncharacterized protein n=1 Tax=Prunus dulcis TaxID=3755 RepID=A0AAD4VRM4_PRUDU|nr:hypothetical protein L3X38_029310 [Prunus dulcis]
MYNSADRISELPLEILASILSLLPLKEAVHYKKKDDVLESTKKIDELELQLQEAEDIVKDLREELSEAQTQLEKATKNQPQPLAGESLDSDTAAPGLMISQLSSQIDADRYYVPNPHFASLVMRSKEPELYRNGCSQRIRAFERNLLDENLSLSVLVDDAKNATFIRGDDEGKGMCNTPKPKVGNTHGVEKNQEQPKVMQLDGSHIQAPAFKSFQNKRKRAARYRRRKVPHAGFVRPCSVQKAMDNDKMIIEESELTRQEYLSAAKLEILACKTDVEKDNRPLNKSDMRASDLDGGTASQLADNKFLIYTFCRKRKKEALSSPERLSLLDNDTLERKTGGTKCFSRAPEVKLIDRINLGKSTISTGCSSAYIFVREEVVEIEIWMDFA